MKLCTIIYLTILVALILLHEFISISALESDRSEQLLSRKRRYLVFPEGSSLQMVYDQIVPIVDVTNLFIFGLTCALAWELPDKPVNIEEQLMEIYENGTLPFFQRKDENITKLVITDNISADLSNEIDSFYKHQPLNYVIQRQPDSYYFNDVGYSKNLSINELDNNYYNEISDKYKKLSKSNKEEYYFKYNKNKYDYLNYSKNGYNSKETKKNITILTDTSRSSPNFDSSKSPYIGNTNHVIHPIFGKRSVDYSSTLEEHAFLHHHRKTRHHFYELLKNVLISKGLHGNECILKALCETGQKYMQPPGTFLGEILRAIFSLPNPIKPATQNNHKLYDEAHKNSQNCTDQYIKCPFSIWDSEFLL